MRLLASTVRIYNHFRSARTRDGQLVLAGALRDTKNSGLQSAMDHLLAHGDDPVPDPSGAGATSTTDVPMDEDDEDAEALRAAMGKPPGLAAATTSAEGAEAKASLS